MNDANARNHRAALVLKALLIFTAGFSIGYLATVSLLTVFMGGHISGAAIFTLIMFVFVGLPCLGWGVNADQNYGYWQALFMGFGLVLCVAVLVFNFFIIYIILLLVFGG